MKKALICIAKNEDYYIDEWIQYNLKLGFTRIFVYQNNWRFAHPEKYGNVEWIEFDGQAKQIQAYNDFIEKYAVQYDWAAFLDVDEFLRLPSENTLDEYLSQFDSFYGIAVNWRLFGDSHKHFDSQDTSCLNRFTLCQKKLNKHVKTILNIKKCGNMAHFVNPHFVNISLKNNVIASAAKDRFVHGPWNDDPVDNGVWINHYFCKTIEEYKQIKLPRGKGDTPASHPQYFRKLEEFDAHNFNEIEDLTAKDFFAL